MKRWASKKWMESGRKRGGEGESKEEGVKKRMESGIERGGSEIGKKVGEKKEVMK